MTGAPDLGAAPSWAGPARRNFAHQVVLKPDMAVARASIWCAKHGMPAARIWEDTAQ